MLCIQTGGISSFIDSDVEVIIQHEEITKLALDF